MREKIFKHKVARVYISLDAATEETYAKVRLTNNDIEEDTISNEKLKILEQDSNRLQNIENNNLNISYSSNWSKKIIFVILYIVKKIIIIITYDGK